MATTPRMSHGDTPYVGAASVPGLTGGEARWDRKRGGGRGVSPPLSLSLLFPASPPPIHSPDRFRRKIVAPSHINVVGQHQFDLDEWEKGPRRKIGCTLPCGVLHLLQPLGT
jgi:hypothetical protein